MGSVYCPESDTTYVDLDAWLAGEAGSAFKTAEVSGTVAFVDGQLRDDEFTGGALITAASGEEFDISNVNAAHAVVDGSIRILSRNNGVYHNVSNIQLTNAYTFTTATDNPEPWYKNCYFKKTSSSDTVDFFSDSVDSSAGSIENCVFDGNGSNSAVDGVFQGSITSIPFVNCLGVDIQRFGFIRANFKNCLVIDAAVSGTGSDYFQSNAVSDYNASSDTTAPGSNSITGVTNAELVDYAGGDWRTSSSSVLATAGEGGTFIGAALESGSGNEYLINGDVPVELTPVADFLLNRSYNIGGQSSLELSPNSDFELNREYIFSGDVPFNIFPDSETSYSSGNSIDGNISYSVIPTALFEINRSYSIDGLTNIEFTVQSSKQKNINVVIDGNIPIEVTPSANFQFGIENIIDGDVNFDITPASSFVLNRQYILNGSVGINLTPNSGTDTTKNYIYNGQSEVSFSVEGEFEFDGQKLINGDVQINVLPNSEMVLDRVQVIKDPLFTLSVEDEVITLSVESSVEVIYAVAR